jgi:hypothetical protein
MRTHARILRFSRQLHLYLGVFIAPAILFFAVTGALQTLSLHETTKGSNYKPANWIVVLAQLHKKQTVHVPLQKLQSTPQPVSTGKPQKSAPAQDKPAQTDAHSLPMKVFFLVVSAGLVTSTFSGLYMSYKYSRNKVVMTVLFVAGIVVPIALTIA